MKSSSTVWDWNFLGPWLSLGFVLYLGVAALGFGWGFWYMQTRGLGSACCMLGYVYISSDKEVYPCHTTLLY